MNTTERVCPHCVHKNPAYRFWCEDCNSFLPQPTRELLLGEALRRERERRELYQKVLVDLTALQRSNDVPGPQTESVRSFFRDQLSQVAIREAKVSNALSIDKMLSEAGDAAQKGNLSQAVQILTGGASEHPGVLPYEVMLKELNERIAKQQASREAGELLLQSREWMRLGRLEDAMQTISRASELDPGSRSVQGALEEITARIAADQAAAAVKAVQVEDVAEDEIVTASLVEPVEPVDLPIDNEVVRPSLEEERVVEPETSQLLSIHESSPASVEAAPPAIASGPVKATVRRSFAEEEAEVPSQTQRLIDAASQWSTVLKPFLVDNVGWFVGAFLVIAGFVVLIVSFWGSIEQNRILMHSLVYLSLAVATGMFFAMAYFMRVKYPQLENSSNVLLVIVALLIPLVFAAAVMTTLLPIAPTAALIQASMG